MELPTVWIDDAECMGAGTCEAIVPEVLMEIGDGLWAVAETTPLFSQTVLFDGAVGPGHGPQGIAGRARVPLELARCARGERMSLDWLLIRGSGLVAFALLGSATIWGLLISGKLLGRSVKAKGLTWLHESLGVAALLATIVHMVALSVHDFLPFSWSEILIPGRSTWRPVAVSLGTISFYVLVVVSLSFYVKRFIGQPAWRAIHHLSFGSFVASLAHGLAAGTDTAHPAVVGLYTGFGTVVTVLLAIRVAQGREPTRPERARPAAARRESEAVS